MSTPLVILCPGQGAQALGMARAWVDASAESRAVFDEADRVLGDRLGARLSTICFEGPADRLNQTDVSQPAIYTASIACWRGMLARKGLTASDAPLAATLGLSLGEYTALCVAGALSFADGLELVTLRGRAMQDAATANPGSMVALIGADEAQAQTVCDKAAWQTGEPIVCANFNAPGQIVISGGKKACEASTAIAGEMGLRATALVVAGAFHSPLMQPAADRLGEALAKTKINEPRCPVVANVTARPHTAADGLNFADSVRKRLSEQLTSSVRWSQSCEWAGANIKGEYHELAPGRTLAGLMRRIDKLIKVTSNEEPG